MPKIIELHIGRLCALRANIVTRLLTWGVDQTFLFGHKYPNEMCRQVASKKNVSARLANVGY